MTKRCTACGEVQPLEGFHRHREGVDGRRSQCKTCVKRKNDAWRAANRTRVRAQNAAWRHANGERFARMVEAWRHRNIERSRAAGRANMRRRKLGLTGSGGRAYRHVLRGDPCSYCGASMEEVDHIDPIARGGPNTWDNLTAACKGCNSSKRATPLLRFLLRIGDPGLEPGVSGVSDRCFTRLS